MDNIAISIDLNKFISSISLALDLAESCALRDKSGKVDFNVAVPDFSVFRHNFGNHSKKTALVAKYIADKLHYSKERQSILYIAAFLHDIGAVDAFECCHSDKNFIFQHSELGASIIEKLPVDSSIPGILKFHHENFDGSGPNGLKGSDIPEESQIIHLADMIELMYQDNISNIVQREKILSWIKTKRGSLFCPYLVDSLIDAASAERFWLDIENLNNDPDIIERIQPKIYTPLTLEGLKDIAEVFASIIDKKSRFTHEHSIGLTNVAAKFSKYYGYSVEKTTMMKIAALLHDLGKLAVPNDILDKPSRLTKEEFDIIKTHTYYTKLILNKITGLEDIAEWAANHHETLSGKGYPECLNADSLSKESRIMAVCDIYQALTESRPYRDGMSRDKALSIIDDMVSVGNIDGDIVRDLKEII